jgi:hypothetical protein
MLLDCDGDKTISKEERACRCPLNRSLWLSVRRIAMMDNKSRRVILGYALCAVRAIALGAPTALAANAEGTPSLHNEPWPIRNGHNYQPTEDELRALHLEDVTPDQAREIDRLYDQLLTGSDNVPNRHPTPKH